MLVLTSHLFRMKTGTITAMVPAGRVTASPGMHMVDLRMQLRTVVPARSSPPLVNVTAIRRRPRPTIHRLFSGNVNPIQEQVCDTLQLQMQSWRVLPTHVVSGDCRKALSGVNAIQLGVNSMAEVVGLQRSATQHACWLVGPTAGRPCFKQRCWITKVLLIIACALSFCTCRLASLLSRYNGVLRPTGWGPYPSDAKSSWPSCSIQCTGSAHDRSVSLAEHPANVRLSCTGVCPVTVRERSCAGHGTLKGGICMRRCVALWAHHDSVLSWLHDNKAPALLFIREVHIPLDCC